MKVVVEIIAHLYQSGLISATQLEQLKREGFYPDDYQQYDDSDNYSYYDHYDHYDYLDEYDCSCEGQFRHGGYCNYSYKKLDQRPGQSNKSNRRASVSTKPNRLSKAVEIAEAITKQQPVWQTELAELLQIAQAITKSTTITDAPQQIRNSSASLLNNIIEQALNNHTLSFNKLWQIISFNKYAEIITDSTLRGPAVTAYRQVLTGRKKDEFHKQAWILREAQISWVYNLILAQRVLLTTTINIFNNNPTLIARAIHREYHHHQSAYWTLVILDNARQGSQINEQHFSDPYQIAWHNPFNIDGRDNHEIKLWCWNLAFIKEADDQRRGRTIVRFTEEHESLLLRLGRDLDEQNWQQSWTYALSCDPVNVLPLFIAVFRHWPSKDYLWRYSDVQN